MRGGKDGGVNRQPLVQREVITLFKKKKKKSERLRTQTRQPPVVLLIQFDVFDQ